MKRVLEPELMEDLEQSQAYSSANFSSSNNLFIQYISKNTSTTIQNVLDLGCGPADVDIELAHQHKNCSITALDGSQAMVDIGRCKVENHKLSHRINIQQSFIPDPNIKPADYDLIISKDLLHHLPDPSVLWREMDRLANAKTQIYVMDLLRPGSEQEAREIVNETSFHEPEVLKLDFYNSLLAAFTMEEMESQLQNTHFKYHIDRLGDRHFILKCSKKTDF